MAHVSHKLTNSFEGALAGGGDPATSPLYVFGPFLKLIVIAGVARVTFGVSVWMVVLTVVMVSAMYRLVMRWIVDGSGGSGLSEEEFGSWAVKINAGITFVEYTLTFLVSVAALVTFIADRFPILNQTLLGIQYRTLVGILLSVLVGWVVNLGPKVAARTFGPATLAVLALLWIMIGATIWKLGLHLPGFNFQAFTPPYLNYTLGGYARILALMTGIEIFANLVAAYEGTAVEKSRKAFGSLSIIMGTTAITMLIVGPAVLQLSDPANASVSVFTQTMDKLLPAPLAYAGTLIGVVVLASAAAASAQGLQNLALGLRYRNYVPAALGTRNKHDVADKPVWIEVGIVAVCYLVFGTHEETYLALYAAGVFVLLSMTGWAAAKRLVREARLKLTASHLAAIAGTMIAAVLASIATVVIFVERLAEGAWVYFILIPVLYLVFNYFRSKLGEPKPLEDHLGRYFTGQYLLPSERENGATGKQEFGSLVVPLDGTAAAEHALPLAETIAQVYRAKVTLVNVRTGDDPSDEADIKLYLQQIRSQVGRWAPTVELAEPSGAVAEEINELARESRADLIVMSTHGMPGLDRLYTGDVANKLIRILQTPLLLLRPTNRWQTRTTRFNRLLINLDGSESAELVLPYARGLADRFGGEMILLSVPESDAEEPRIREYLETVEGALRERGYNIRALVTGSGAVRTILQVSLAEAADLIILATHGRGNFERRAAVGSVADRVVDAANCPVLLIPV